MEIGPIARSLARRKSAAALLVMEVAVGMVVMVHNFVLGRYYSAMAFAPSGIDEPNLTYVVRRFGAAVRGEAAVPARIAADLARLTAMDGVVAAAAVDELPFTEQVTFGTALWSDTGARPSPGWAVQATDGVVAALGLRIREGRAFAPGERGVAVVSRGLAERLFPGASPVGHWLSGLALPPARIVGVTEEFRVRLPFAPDSPLVALMTGAPGSEWDVRYVVRTAPGRRAEVVERIDAALRAGLPGTGSDGVGPGEPVDTISAVKFDIVTTRFHRIARGATVVIVWMGLIVVGVALAGALAVASFSVAERTRQIGVRRALGATQSRVIRHFLVENALLTTVGIAVGLTATIPINMAVRQLLPNLWVTAPDVVISMLLFWAAGLVSALIPALRAARIPPTAATRIV